MTARRKRNVKRLAGLFTLRQSRREALKAVGQVRLDVGEDGEKAAEVVDQLGRLSEAGVQAVHGYLVGVDKMKPLEVIGRDVYPRVKDL